MGSGLESGSGIGLWSGLVLGLGLGSLGYDPEHEEHLHLELCPPLRPFLGRRPRRVAGPVGVGVGVGVRVGVRVGVCREVHTGNHTNASSSFSIK